MAAQRTMGQAEAEGEEEGETIEPRYRREETRLRGEERKAAAGRAYLKCRRWEGHPAIGGEQELQASSMGGRCEQEHFHR